jgi:hypothetical protein
MVSAKLISKPDYRSSGTVAGTSTALHRRARLPLPFGNRFGRADL